MQSGTLQSSPGLVGAASSSSTSSQGVQGLVDHQPGKTAAGPVCVGSAPTAVEPPLSDSITSESAHVDVLPVTESREAAASGRQDAMGRMTPQPDSPDPVMQPAGHSPHGSAAGPWTDATAHHDVAAPSALASGAEDVANGHVHHPAHPTASCRASPPAGSTLHDTTPPAFPNHAGHSNTVLEISAWQQHTGSSLPSHSTPALQGQHPAPAPALDAAMHDGPAAHHHADPQLDAAAMEGSAVVKMEPGTLDQQHALAVQGDMDMPDQRNYNADEMESDESDEKWGRYLEVTDEGNNDKGCQASLPVPDDYPRLSSVRRQRKRPADWELDPMHLLALAAAEQPSETNPTPALLTSQWGGEQESGDYMPAAGGGLHGRVTSYASLSSLDLPPARASRAGDMVRMESELDLTGLAGPRGASPAGDDDYLHTSSQHGKRPRLAWTPELHAKFVQVVDILGPSTAVPKTILHMMGVKGLTREQVASHLQKYRLYLKKGGVAGGGNAPDSAHNPWGAMGGSRGTPPRAATPPRGSYQRASRQVAGMERSGSGEAVAPRVEVARTAQPVTTTAAASNQVVSAGGHATYRHGQISTSQKLPTVSVLHREAQPDVGSSRVVAPGQAAVTLLPTAQVSRPVGAAAWLGNTQGLQLPLPALAKAAQDKGQAGGGAAGSSAGQAGGDQRDIKGGVLMNGLQVAMTNNLGATGRSPAQQQPKMEADDAGPTGHVGLMGNLLAAAAAAAVADGSGPEEQEQAGALAKRPSQNSGVAAGGQSKAQPAGDAADGLEGTSGEHRGPSAAGTRPQDQQQQMETLQNWAGKQGYRIVVCMPNGNEMGVMQQQGMQQPMYAPAQHMFTAGPNGMPLVRMPMQAGQGMKAGNTTFHPAPAMFTMAAPMQGMQWVSSAPGDGDVMGGGGGQQQQQQQVVASMQAMPQMTMVNGRPYMVQQAMPQAMQLIPGTGMARMIHPMMPMQMGMIGQQGGPVNMSMPMPQQQDNQAMQS